MSNLINRRWKSNNLMFQLYCITVRGCSWTVRGTICTAIKGPGVSGIPEDF